ncbi:MEKHLA domain-containing protein [Kineosporia sp. J2-2]|uniref:MEKHLA domain-containing protein n=1 Tax=Kineosporia corallincola TaxID=2835133 RepID=A0ABS5TFN3_9ACTN|nr:MEKHLA domain-containing protein [Kineosporia corallincola]MBT0769897.1 MEKHLA domain-containing protein [Kineosporia corallincola]
MKTSADFADLLITSYSRRTGTDLVAPNLRGAEAAAWLYQAPFGLLVHDTAPDPVFVYANLTAQSIFGYSWDEFVGLPSRLSADEDDRDDRQVFMEAVARRGYAENYRGRRITKHGRCFWIEQTTVWNLAQADGSPAGQAAMIRRWKE